MPSALEKQNTVKIPGNWLYGLSFLAGITIYFLLACLKQPGLGIPLGFITWFTLIGQAVKLSNKMMIRHAEELLTQGNHKEALDYLRQITEKYKSYMEIRAYYEQKLKEYAPDTMGEIAAFTNAAVVPEVVHTETSLDAEQELEPLLQKEEAPKLSVRAVWILVLAPFAFMPIFRQTSPYIGLWPALIMMILGVSIITSPNKWDKAVGKFGLGLVFLSLVFFAFSLLGNGIPGKRPGLKFDFNPEKSDWVVKLFGFVVLMFSVVLHEVAHAFAAFFSGDPTAKDQGRITLNPVKHVDLFGTIILPALMYFLPGGVVFGWAKPVEVSPNNFRNYRRGQLAVSLAGVAVNFLLAMFSCSMLITIGILLHRYYPGISTTHFMSPWAQVTLSGVPCAGIWIVLIETFKAGILINMTLFSLNILPVPPLDGYGIVEGLIFKKLRDIMGKIRRWGSMIFLFMIFTHIIDYLLLPGIAVAWLLNVVAGNLAKLW